MPCVYLATNTVNGKRYVGFASDLKARKKIHRCEALSRSSPYLFYKAIRKYGWDAFTWEVLHESDDAIHLLKVMEPHCIAEMKTFHEDGLGYNMTRGGDGIIGFRFTEEQLQRLSAAHMGIRHSEATREKMRASHLGRENSESHNAAISKAFSKRWLVTTPDGLTVEVVNLKDFCRLNGLRYPAMHRIAMGGMRSHRGHSVRLA